VLRVILESLRALISFPTNTRIWIAAGITDMRKGFTGLSAIVQVTLEQDPLCGHVFVFEAAAVIWSRFFGSTAMGFAYLRSVSTAAAYLAESGERYSFADAGAVSMLCEGIDWRRVERTAERVMAI